MHLLGFLVQRAVSTVTMTVFLMQICHYTKKCLWW